MARKGEGKRSSIYRQNVESRLAVMGYSTGKYQWLSRPARLTVIVDDGFRNFELHAGQSKSKTEYELGRLDVWAEIMRLQPRAVASMPRKITGGVLGAPKKPAEPPVVDIEELIARTKANGVAHG